MTPQHEGSRPDATPAGARPTPYELVFGDAAFEAAWFPSIREEAETRGVDDLDPDRFVLLGRVGRLLRELVPEEAGTEAYRELGLVVFQAYHFWRLGRRVYVVDEPLARWLLDAPHEVGAWEMTPPYPAGYLQLPRNLLWARVEEAERPEPVDGFFWTMVGEEDPATPPYRRVDALLVLGVREGRPGFSVIPVGAEVGEGPGHWAESVARAEGPDFASDLPGGAEARLYTVANEIEALKLVSLAFWYAAAAPGSVGEEEGVAGAALPVRRIRLAGDRG
jgi:hypothetical protein